jgi:putative SOS response-associated peptidase YedK
MAPIFDHKGSRHLVQAFWSLISPLTESREEARKVSTFNAKAETLITRPTFTNAFLKRRCIVPAEGFYEWVGPKSGRQPLSIQRADGKLLSMAGLFNYWRSKDAKEPPTATFTVVTTMPNKWMARIHNRMPVILQDNQIDTWLDPAVSDPQHLGVLLKAPPENESENFFLLPQPGHRAAS